MSKSRFRYGRNRKVRSNTINLSNDYNALMPIKNKLCRKKRNTINLSNDYKESIQTENLLELLSRIDLNTTTLASLTASKGGGKGGGKKPAPEPPAPPPDWRNPPISSGTLNVCIGISPDANVEGGARINREIEAANEIWQRSTSPNIDGITFDVVNTQFLSTSLNAETLSTDSSFNGPLHQTFLNLIEDMECGNTTDVYVFYLPGRFVNKPNNGDIPIDERPFATAWNWESTDGSNTNVIIMTDEARQRFDENEPEGNNYVLAHEFGHILYFTNSISNGEDPNPDTTIPNQRGHNINDGNLMYRSATPHRIPTITDEQIGKALYSELLQ